ncbi:hypothetical protein CC86DRAFT_384013 [Ophiobolus disseminans]|uniref:DUF6697 domain-containing protein n=1 Tax=Ophiobolus disseminans TaxID=1469910 RepID=A0A6A6ZVI6_9PLEO|nr:hypothetical protein CC86DRAFT_384013 [Ophiobolus disseminans]
MSDRDPNIFGHSYTYPMNYNMHLNPAATDYAPEAHRQDNMPSQVSAAPSPYLEARVLNLEEEHDSLRGEVLSLTEMHHELCSSVDKLKKGGWPVTVGPFQDQDLTQSHLRAMEFKHKLEELSRAVHQSVDGVADEEKINGTTTPKANGNMPPHLRATGTAGGAVSKSLPPHLRGKAMSGTKEHSPVESPNNCLVTDGPVDTVTITAVPAAMPSPPMSPATVVQQDLSVDQLSLTSWKPYYLNTLKPFTTDTKVPTAGQMVTFHPQFLDQHLGGTDWSPGLKFVPGEHTCIIKNRTYYMLDPSTEPYQPEAPGLHGAKLTAFFNENPEDSSDFSGLPDGATSYEDVPMFVKQNDRYVYFGNYSQTRWSDKLDYDTMMARVPQHIKEFWATELTSPVRPAWVTEELKNHFFKKPEYSGRLHPASEADATTVTSEEEVVLNDKMARDVRKYVEELRDWEREAKMKTAMIKKQFILDAFDAADADFPPALRLWWEYLECVNWRKDFYDLLVTLQSRDARFSK